MKEFNIIMYFRGHGELLDNIKKSVPFFSSIMKKYNATIINANTELNKAGDESIPVLMNNVIELAKDKKADTIVTIEEIDGVLDSGAYGKFSNMGIITHNEKMKPFADYYNKYLLCGDSMYTSQVDTIFTNSISTKSKTIDTIYFVFDSKAIDHIGDITIEQYACEAMMALSNSFINYYNLRKVDEGPGHVYTVLSRRNEFLLKTYVLDNAIKFCNNYPCAKVIDESGKSVYVSTITKVDPTKQSKINSTPSNKVKKSKFYGGHSARVVSTSKQIDINRM